MTIEPTQHDVPTADTPSLAAGIPFGEPLSTDLADTSGLTVLKAGSVIPSEAARDLLLEQFSPLRAAAPQAPDPADADTNEGAATNHAAGTDGASAPGATGLGEELNAPRPSGSADGPGPATREELGLEIGALLRLQPPKASGLGALGCRVIGVAPNHSVFITPPTANGQAVDLVFGERLNAVYVSRRAVYGFICTVQSTFRQPFPYVLLSPPGPISRMRARSALRARVRFFALIGQASSRALDGAGIVRNVSASGLNISAREGFAAINDVIRVSFCLHTIGRNHQLEVSGRVRHVRRDEHPGHVSYGIQLDDLSTHDRLLLSYYVLEQTEFER